MFKARLLALSAAALGLHAPALAQTAAAPPAKARWSIDYGVQRCSLFRSEGTQGTVFGLRIIPGRGDPEILFTRDSFKPLGLDYAVRAALVLQPSGKRFEGGVVWTDLPDGKQVMMVDKVGRDFIDALAASSSLALEARGKRLDLAFSGASGAVKALRECNDALLRAWGADVSHPDGTVLPEPLGGGFESWFSSELTPGELARRSSGTVVARLDIGADGRLTGCTVLAGSGDKVLDSRSCETFLRRGRYKPARDPAGNPIAVKIVQTIHWLVGS